MGENDFEDFFFFNFTDRKYKVNWWLKDHIPSIPATTYSSLIGRAVFNGKYRFVTAADWVVTLQAFAQKKSTGAKTSSKAHLLNENFYDQP